MRIKCFLSSIKEIDTRWKIRLRELEWSSKAESVEEACLKIEDGDAVDREPTYLGIVVSGSTSAYFSRFRKESLLLAIGDP